MTCIWCGKECQASTDLLPGHTLYRCKPCKLLTAAGLDRWIKTDGTRTIEVLRKLLDRREELDVIDEAAKTSDETDPRWATLVL